MDWVVCGACLISVVVLGGGDPVANDQRFWPVLFLVLFGSVPLLWRRSHPAVVLAVVLCAFCVSLAVAPLTVLAGLLCAAYAAALYGRSRVRTIVGVAAAVALLLAFGMTLPVTQGTQIRGPLETAPFGFGLAWVAGDRTRARLAYVAGLEERAVWLERERDEQSRLAAEEERVRIARELHDVVTHNVSLIAVHAGAARVTSASHPERAEEALSLIERTARATLSELRALLGVLRRGHEPELPMRPQPSLAQMDELLDQARAAGLRVTARVEGRVHSLPVVTDLCAYRVMQEALTNAVKHAPRSTVRVLLCYEAEALTLTIVDDGASLPGGGQTGHGLAGMRERVTLAGGELTVGPVPGGFGVRAHMPLLGDGALVDASQPRAPLAEATPAREQPA
jgi:signal transduction histidine kinase